MTVIKPIGLTKDVGWEIGARRSFPIPLETAWELLSSNEGVNMWLGITKQLAFDFTVGATYELSDGSVGEVRVFKPNSHLRITWQPPGWERASLIQVRVIPSGQRTVIAFHQEHLRSAQDRIARREHFAAVLAQINALVEDY